MEGGEKEKGREGDGEREGGRPHSAGLVTFIYQAFDTHTCRYIVVCNLVKKVLLAYSCLHFACRSGETFNIGPLFHWSAGRFLADFSPSRGSC